MQAIEFSQQLTTNLSHYYQALTNLSVAFILGALIGYERQFRQRIAGLRTNTLVATSSAIFVHLAFLLAGPTGAVRVIAYVVSGVGFLGAGTIMKEGMNVRGLNTAATLWGSAAVGACAGSNLISEAIVAAIFVIMTNTLLRPLVNIINRQPFNDLQGELTYHICVIVDEKKQKKSLAFFERILKEFHCPLSQLDIEPFGDDDVEITALLFSTSMKTELLDQITERLLSSPLIKQAYVRRTGRIG